jgi:xylulokinase
VVLPGNLSISVGTSGVVFGVLDSFTSDPMARAHVFCHGVPETWHAMGVMLSAAGSLRWFRDVMAPGVSFATLTEEAAAWGPGAEGAMFLPYLSGERTPHADPSARAAFCGLFTRHDRGALVRAVLEGVAYGLRDSLELLRDMGVEIGSARISGGGAKDRLWLDIIASVLRMPLEVTPVQDASAYGAALLGGVAAGTFASVVEASEACVTVDTTIEPVEDWIASYEDGYEVYRSLYPALKSTGVGASL